MVSPILLYSAEVWGINDYQDADKIHMKFCKTILGVRKQTTNAAILGELGRYPLSVMAKGRALKFWIKLLRDTDSLGYKLYHDQCDVLAVNPRHKCWAGHVKPLRAGTMWTHQATQIPSISLIKQRINDQYIQSWSATVNSSPKLDSYSKFKTSFVREPYLHILKSDNLRKHMTAFRTVSHKLEIETGRYTNTPRIDRKCKLCSMNVVESEFHFLLICPKYNILRRLYLPHRAWPTLQYFHKLLSSENKKNDH